MPFFQNETKFFNELYNKITIDQIHDGSLTKKTISLSLLRLDKMHPYISGNKIFKLKYFLLEAMQKQQQIITFGGAYSNHLVATAAVCKVLNIPAIGIVRGQAPANISHSLQLCINSGMKLKFIPRETYDQEDKSELNKNLIEEFGQSVMIPEGGFHTNGVKGAKGIRALYNEEFTHIVCAVGTSTTLAGLITAAQDEQIVGINVTKNLDDIKNRLDVLLNNTGKKNYHLFNEYNFGGYARSNVRLFRFMNDFYHDHQIPLDFIYTGKMMYATTGLILKDYFPPESKILCLHTGGLQGNLSLQNKQLIF